MKLAFVHGTTLSERHQDAANPRGHCTACRNVPIVPCQIPMSEAIVNIDVLPFWICGVVILHWRTPDRINVVPCGESRSARDLGMG